MARRLGPNHAVAWLGPPAGAQGVAGQAFLVGEQVALTCAHVVRDHLALGPTTPADRPTAKVTLNFGALRRPIEARVAECGWFPDGCGADLEDVAVLILDEPLDEIPHPGIAPVDPRERESCYAYGSLAAHVGVGQTAWAFITPNLNDSGWHQLDADAARGGYFVKRGFSGAPVMDPMGVTIWGMIVAVDREAEAERRLVAFALPAEALRDAHTAVKRCARNANRSTPDVSIRPEGPLDPLGRRTVVALNPPHGVASVPASGVTATDGTHDPGPAEDLVDAVRALAEAGAEPSAKDLAAAGLRGLQTGDTAAAEKFFGARLQVATEPIEAPRVALPRVLGFLLGKLGRVADAILAPPATSPAPSPPAAPANRASAAQDARRLGAILTLRDTKRALASYWMAAELEPDDGATWIEVSRLARQAGDLEGAANAAEAAGRAAARSGDARQSSLALDELGDVRVAQGDLPGALAAYTADKDIADRLAAADPGNAQWQRDLIVSHAKLAGLLEQMPHRAAEAAGHWSQALAVARTLAATGRLAPTDAHFVETLEQRLAAAPPTTAPPP